MKFSAEYLQHVVERLASIGSHPLGFRVAGTPEEREAVDFIAGEMRSLGSTNVVEEPVRWTAGGSRTRSWRSPTGLR